MKKSTVKNWMKYFASTIAISGIMLLGACGSDENTADEVYAPETEVVNREVDTEEYIEDEVVATETVQDNQNMTASRNTASSVNINRLLDKYPDVNQAIRTTLTTMTSEESMNNEYAIEENEIN